MHTIKRFTDIDAVAGEWDRLADELEAPPFLRPGWTKAWLSAFTSRGFTACTVWRDGRLVALAPVIVRPRSIVSTANQHSPVWNLLAVDDAALHLLIDDILQMRPDRVSFSWLDVESPAASAFASAMADKGYRKRVRARVRSPFSVVDTSWERFEERLSRRRRSQIRRYARRLSDQGEVRFESFAGNCDLDALLVLLVKGYRVEGSGWKGQQGTAIASQTSTQEFYTTVALWAAERDWLRLTFLELDGRPLAFEYLLTCGDTTYYVKAGYDEDYGKWSPSTLLMRHTLHSAVSDPIRYFEWLGDDDRYKLEWSDGVRERVNVDWFAPTLIGASSYIARALAQEVAKKVRQTALALLPPSTVQRMKGLKGTGRRVLQRWRRAGAT